MVFTHVTKILATVATPPCWCTVLSTKKLVNAYSDMVLCLIVDCASKSGQDINI